MKILMLSDSPFLNTGYSSQTLWLLNGLAEKGHECSLIAHNYQGQELPKGSVKLADGTPFNFGIIPNGREPYAKDILEQTIRELRPDAFIILLDTFMLFPWLVEKDLAPAHSFFWFPSDGGRFPQNCEMILNKMSMPVAMAKYGQKQVFDTLKLQKCAHIPHGVDTTLFKPLSDKERGELRTKWGLQGKFVVGIMGRNQSRKMHDRAIKAFYKYAKLNEDAILLCHFDPEDAASVFDVKLLINDYNLNNRVLFTGTKYYKGMTYAEMNEIYNLMDVYFCSTSGEGFGLGTIEAMACGLPVVITDYTTSRELVDAHGAGEMVNLVGTDALNCMEMNMVDYDNKVVNGTITGSWGVERGLMCVDDAVKKLDLLAKDFKLRETYSRNGLKAVKSVYDWPIVVESWEKLLLEVCGSE